MSETNPNNPPPSGYGIPLFQWLVENVLFIKRRLNGFAQSMSSGVTSVFGRTGIVTAEEGDYSAFYINLNEKAMANGVATLDSGGLVPLSQLPFSSPLICLGNWDASTNTPTLTAGTGVQGNMYIVSVAGTQDIGEGSYAYQVGDVIVANEDGDWILVGSVGGAHINGNGFVIASGTTISYLTGTSAQFVKADGTLDSTVYLPLSGGTLTDGANIAVGSSTGTKIGTATTQKIGFFNSTPVVQQTGNIITALQTLGLVTSGTISAADMSTLLATVNSWTAAQVGSIAESTMNGTVNIDLSSKNNFLYQITGASTLGVPTNYRQGQSGVIDIWQDSTGSRTLAYDSRCYVFKDGTAPTITATKGSNTQYAYYVKKSNGTSGATATISNASPAVVTSVGHGLLYGMKVWFTTTGGLPTGLSVNTPYWVNPTGTDTFNVSSSLANLQAGTYIATSSAGSGTHTMFCLEIFLNANTDVK